MEVVGPARAPQVADLPGRVLGERYRVDGIIGRGQASAVFRGADLVQLRPVAVKVLTADPDDELELGARLEREARIAASVRHPGIVEIHAHGVTPDGLHFLVMELLGGETLAAKLAREGRLAPGEAVRVGAGIASALSVLHALGYAHRDLKPSNVFLVPRGDGGRDVKLVDFGALRPVSLAGIHDDKVAKKTLLGIGKRAVNTLPGVVFGAPQYMSPEQASGLELDARSDVYALGALTYEMLTGSPPFDDQTDVRQIARHLAELPVPPSRRAPDACIPRSLDAVVLKALAKRREDRHASASEMSAGLWWALAEARETPGGRASADSIELPLRRRPWRLALVAIGVGASAVAAAAAWRSWRAEKPAIAAAPAPAMSATATAAAPEPHGPVVEPVGELVASGPVARASAAPAPRDTAPHRQQAAPRPIATTDLKDPYQERR